MGTTPAQPSLPNNLPSIPMKLDGTNYYLWKSIMTSLLQSYNLLEYAEGEKTAPPPTITEKQGTATVDSPNPEFQQWRTYDQFYLACIYLAVSPDIGLQLVGLRTAAEAWSKLQNLYDSQTYAQREFLEQQWRDITKGERPMTDYLKDVTDLATRFAQAGQPKQPTEVNDRILAGLGEDWEPLILSLAPTLGTMSTDDLSVLLLNQDARRAYRRSRTGPPLSGLAGSLPVANAAYGGRTGQHGSPGGHGRVSGRRGRGRHSSFSNSFNPNWLQEQRGRRQHHGSFY